MIEPTTAAVTVQNSESGIIYQLYNGASTSGTSKLGTGSNMVLISGILTSSATLTVKSIRIGTSCSATLSNSVSVTVTTVDSTITESSGVLTATQNGATYQWYQCPSTLISGQTNQSFTPSVAGDYNASVTVGGCSVTTNCFSVVLSATDFDNTTFSYYPNPTNGILNINYSETISKIQVNNLLGQEVLSKIINNKQGQIDMQHLPSGTYFVKVASEDKVKTLKIVRE